MMRRIFFLLLAISIFAAPTAYGAVSDEEFEELRQQLAAVSERLDQLAAENAELRQSQAEATTTVGNVRKTESHAPSPSKSINIVQTSEPDASVPSWSDRIRMDGDFRYRYERIDVDNSDTRKRNRIRARANIRADLADDVEVGFGLATGGDDPVSTNQTLGAGGSSKNVSLNLAYADWEVTDGLHLIAGKFNSPLTRVGKQALMWDADWSPEGLALKYQRDWFYTNAIGSWLESDSKTDNDTFSWGAQFGASGEFAGAQITGGLAYYSIRTKGKSTTFGDPSDPDDYFGNTAVDSSGLPCGISGETCSYLYDYLLTELFAEAKFSLGDWPTVVFLDYVNNSDPSKHNSGWTMGGRVGQTKDRGQMQFSYLYADKGANAMLGLLTDSDFAGGGTDNKGHFLKFTYGVNKTWSIGAQYFINEIDVASGAKADYNRLILDTQWKWK